MPCPRDDGGVTSIDLNADLGEIEGDLALMEAVSSANVACGAHAGDEGTMRAAVAEAEARGVRVGAHPSYLDREGFGRVERNEPAARLADEVAEQVERLASIGEVGYVKLHGALYHRANTDEEAAEAILDKLPVRHVLSQEGFFLAGARRRGFGASVEGFCDRAYRPDGTLVPRGAAGAVLTESSAVVAQALALARSGRYASLCLHGDTPGALDLARAVRRALEADGITVAAFS